MHVSPLHIHGNGDGDIRFHQPFLQSYLSSSYNCARVLVSKNPRYISECFIPFFLLKVLSQGGLVSLTSLLESSQFHPQALL
jgi:hypothetical protein